MRTKGYLAFLAAAVSLAAAWSVTAPAAGAGTSGAVPVGQRVVVLVPGQQPVPGTSSLDQFDALAEQLSAEGYVVHPVGVLGLDLYSDAARIGQAVDEATEGVDVESLAIVAHSYGGLSARQYLKALGGSDTVDTYIAIGTPQYGSPGGASSCPAKASMDVRSRRSSPNSTQVTTPRA